MQLRCILRLDAANRLRAALGPKCSITVRAGLLAARWLSGSMHSRLAKPVSAWPPTRRFCTKLKSLQRALASVGV
eukprot:140870-Chlamydomonas_euryale.AAC.1